MRIRFSAAVFGCALAFFPVTRARAGTTVKSGKSNSSDRQAAASTTATQPARTPTVKSSKSNSSDRAIHSGATDPTPAEANAVKTGTSNSSDHKTAASTTGTNPEPMEAARFHGNTLNQSKASSPSKSNIDRKAGLSDSGTRPAEAINLNSSKSNAYRTAESSTSGVVTNIDAASRTISIRQANGSIMVMDASRLARVPKVGLRVNVEYTNVGGKATAQSIAVSDPGVPGDKGGSKGNKN